ncbi:FAD assembly factor SdhE [Candidatus Erwinia haradaeae]|uniref:FAD assembly factor SdhE n=1 Tax=Candidatus Erwinia haradaeae TaxID=1922217 RepID=A0A451DI52_9GAMM|nr:FAD assembly factor SdhE [Candidatus Erwinia haradaeae]VFP86342.1 FAD assembly factor SdhE [Candidatus Erwinia haradaeae]
MNSNNKLRIHWACYRGMRELDLLIMPFFKDNFDSLNEKDKKLFSDLLENDDPDLFNWLMNHEQPKDAHFKRIISIIQESNKTRDFSRL